MKTIDDKARLQACEYSRNIDRRTDGLAHIEIAENIAQYVEAAWLAGYNAAIKDSSNDEIALNSSNIQNQGEAYARDPDYADPAWLKAWWDSLGASQHTKDSET